MANIDVTSVENKSAMTNLFDTNNGILCRHGMQLSINANNGIFCIMIDTKYNAIPMNAPNGITATAGYTNVRMHNMMRPEKKALIVVTPPICRPRRLVCAKPVPPIPAIKPLTRLPTPCP